MVDIAESRRGAPVRSTHKMPLSTSPEFLQGRPRLRAGMCSSSGKMDSSTAHCLSVRSTADLNHRSEHSILPILEFMRQILELCLEKSVHIGLAVITDPATLSIFFSRPIFQVCLLPSIIPHRRPSKPSELFLLLTETHILPEARRSVDYQQPRWSSRPVVSAC